MPRQVMEDEAYRNAKINSDRQNAQIEHDSAVRRLITAMVQRQTELYKGYTERRGVPGVAQRRDVPDATYQDRKV